MAKKRYKYDFAKKKHSEKGVTSSVFAGISLGFSVLQPSVPLHFTGKAVCIWGLWD